MRRLRRIPRKLRLALITFVVASVVIGAGALVAIWPRLFLPLEQRVGEAFGACLFGDAEGCSELVPAHLEGCERGLSTHCHQAAELIFQGRIVDEDRPRALALFRRGCDLGGGGSCFAMGRLLREGLGVPADQRAATHAYRAACNLEQWEACQRAALQLAHHDGSDAAWRDAEALLAVACKHGFSLACYNYAVVRTRVDGTPAYARSVIDHHCDVEVLRCDVSALALREPAPRWEQDQRALDDLCRQCGGSRRTKPTRDGAASISPVR